MIKWGPKINIAIRVLLSYFVAIVLVLSIPIMGFAGIDKLPPLGLGLSITFLIIIAVAGSVAQSAIFGFAGMLPPQYTTAVMGGQGAAGLIVSIIRVITKLTLESGDDPSIPTLTLSASIYFFLSCSVVIACFITFIILLRLPFVKYYMRKVN